MKKTEKLPTYTESFKELQDLLQSLEQGDVDVDELSLKVKRAAELIAFCQRRLTETETEVKKVMDSFDAVTETTSSAS